MLIFDDNPHVAVVICKHISEENKPITYISHDLEDGMWQFLCGDIHDIADVQLIALVEILQFGITETLLNQKSLMDLRLYLIKRRIGKFLGRKNYDPYTTLARISCYQFPSWS